MQMSSFCFCFRKGEPPQEADITQRPNNASLLRRDFNKCR